MIQHHTRKKSGALFAAALLASSFISALGGSESKSTSSPTMIEKPPARNPLCFFDDLFCFDVQERVRVEGRNNNFDFNDDVNALTDDWWLLQRFRIGLLFKPTPWLRIYAQGQDSREWLSDRPDFPGLLAAEGDDSFDLRQGYIEIGNPKEFPLVLKVGRQILSYGDERLIGAFDWNNIGRTFDAVKLRYEEKTWWVDAFAASVVVPTRGQYNQSDLFNGNETQREQTFAGIYFSTTAIPVQTTDIYALYLHENPNRFPVVNGDTNFGTFGFRVKSKPGAFAPTPAPEPADGKATIDGKTAAPAPAPAKKPVGFDYDAEVAVQAGEVRELDLTSFAAHAGVGYTFDVAWLPRVGVEYNFATGDDDPADGDIETFQNLFPTNHKFYGYMDVFSWQNIHNPAASLRVTPVKALVLQLDYHAFWLAETDDVWYRANGTTAVRPLDARSRCANNFAGQELDFTVTWNVTKNVSILAGYSHFFAGTYLADTGPSDDADFGYVQTTISF
jgi:hypothetical protein